MNSFNELDATSQLRKLYQSELHLIYDHFFKDKLDSNNSTIKKAAELDLETFINSVINENSIAPFFSIGLKPNAENLVYLLKHFNKKEQKTAIDLLTTPFINNANLLNIIANILIAEEVKDKKDDIETFFRLNSLATHFFNALYIGSNGQKYYKSAIEPYVKELVSYLTLAPQKLNKYIVEAQDLVFFAEILNRATINTFRTTSLPYFIHMHLYLIYNNILKSMPSEKNLALNLSATHLFLRAWPSIFKEYSKESIQQILKQKKLPHDDFQISQLQKILNFILNEPLLLLAKSLGNSLQIPNLHDKNEEAVSWQLYFNSAKEKTKPHETRLITIITTGPTTSTISISKPLAEKTTKRAQKFINLLQKYSSLAPDNIATSPNSILDNSTKKIPQNIFEACQFGTTAEVEALIASVKDLNALDEQGMTALHHAATLSCDIVNLLIIQPTINLNCRDRAGRTPLMLAAQKMQRAKNENDQSYDIVRMFLLNDADPALESQEQNISQPGTTTTTYKHAIDYAGNDKRLFLCHEHLTACLTSLEKGETQNSTICFNEAYICDPKLSELYLDKWLKQKLTLNFSKHFLILEAAKIDASKMLLDDLFTCDPKEIFTIIENQKENFGDIIDFVVKKISWLLSQPQFISLDLQIETAPKESEIALLKEFQAYLNRLTVVINLLQPSDSESKIRSRIYQHLRSCCESTAGGKQKYINQIKLKQIYRLHPNTTRSFFSHFFDSNNNDFDASDFEKLKNIFNALFPQEGNKRSSISPTNKASSFNGTDSSSILHKLSPPPIHSKTAEESSPTFQRKSTIECRESKNYAFSENISTLANSYMTLSNAKNTFKGLLDIYNPDDHIKTEAAKILLNTIFFEQNSFKIENSLYMVCHIRPKMLLKELTTQIKKENTLAGFVHLNQMMDKTKQFLIEINPDSGLNAFSKSFLTLAEECAQTRTHINQLLENNLAKMINIESPASAKMAGEMLSDFNADQKIKTSFVSILIHTFSSQLHKNENGDLLNLICKFDYQPLINFLYGAAQHTQENAELKKLIKTTSVIKKLILDIYFSNPEQIEEHIKVFKELDKKFREVTKRLPEPEPTFSLKNFRTY